MPEELGLEKSQQSKDKKDLILQATTRLLCEQGVQAVSFENIANEAGLSRQLVRYYFSDLDEVFVELCDYFGGIYQEALIKGIVQVGHVERLGFFLDYFFGVSEVHELPPNLQAYDAMFAYSVGCKPLKQGLRKNYQTLGLVMAHELAIAHPELDSGACDELSFLFVSAMHAHWSFVATLGYRREHCRLARQAFERLIASYVKEQRFEPSMKKPWSRDETDD